jgi:N-methylhydantoinase A/oxoprolinase/acetone carboxylase beta subunit
VEAWADVRFKGQSHELQVRIGRPSWAEIEAKFVTAYETTYGRVPAGRAVEVVTVRVRRIGRGAEVTLPKLHLSRETVEIQGTQLVTAESGDVSAQVLTRAELLKSGAVAGPMLLIDAEATAYVPPNWRAEARENGAVILTMGREG